MENSTLSTGSALQSGKYRILKVLGQGGFGITYLAEQTGLGRQVAVKEFFMKDLCNRDRDTSIVSVPSEGSRELVDRYRAKFVKEARLIASLNNQRIIKIHDVFEENGTAYYVMDYLPGGSVSDLLSKTGDLSLNTALKYTRLIGEALNYIHTRPDPLNHLDVKPSNIMLDDNGDAVLVDFGLSKRYDAGGRQTSSTPVGVSHGYAPLEQYKDGGVQEFSPTTDIYSLGATLYKMLTGVTPPQANDVFEEGLPPMPEFIPANIRSAIEKAMQPSKKDRPKSVVEFLNLLDGTVKEDDNEDTVLSGSKSNGKKNGDNQRKSKVPKEEKEKKRFPFLKLLTDFAAFELFQIAVFYLISFVLGQESDEVFFETIISCFYTVVGCVLRLKYEFWSPKFKKHLLIWYIIYFVIFGLLIIIKVFGCDLIILFAPSILLIAMALYELM